ncbi:MAG: hypothetical protein WC967_12700 [Balneolaceae bacterium]
MASFVRGRTNIKISHGFTEMVSKRIKSRLEGGIRSISGKIKDRLRDDIMNMIVSTVVWDGILGNYKGDVDYDLQAHFGLRDPSKTLDIIEKEIRRQINISIRSSSTKNNLKVTITMNDLDYNVIAGLPGGTYISYRRIRKGNKNVVYGTEIPWLSWLMDPSSATVGGWHVNFDLENTEKSRSRSGRALMFKGGGWNIPAVCNPTVGVNFIDDLLLDDKYMSLISRRLIDLIRKAIK